MTEALDIDIGIAEKELQVPLVNRVEVNSYRTRGEPVAATIEGSTSSEWHSVKGGIQNGAANVVDNKSISFEVLYNPELNAWLKIVPPEIISEKREKILRKSVEIARAAFEVAGLPELNDQIIEGMVTIRGQEVYGFVTPHIGQSMEHYVKEARLRGENMEEVRTFVGAVYDTAFGQARHLYEEYGYWTDDPNPGNILLHEKDGQYQVVLIDFSNRHQEKRVKPERIPDHIKDKDALVIQRNADNITLLRSRFAKKRAEAVGSVPESGDRTESTSSPNASS